MTEEEVQTALEGLKKAGLVEEAVPLYVNEHEMEILIDALSSNASLRPLARKRAEALRQRLVSIYEAEHPGAAL